MQPYQRAASNRMRDADRRRKARAILARPNPDRRAVKRAKRLLHDADREGRIARDEAIRSVFADAAAGMRVFMEHVDRSFAAMRGLSDQLGRFRIPEMFPGEELVVVKGSSRVGKTAAMEATMRDLEPYMVKPVAIVPTVRRRPTYTHDILALRIGDFDLDSEEVQAAMRVVAERERRWREAFTRQALLGEPYGAPRRCHHGIWLYGNSCATCAREDRDETASPDTKRSD